MPSSIIPIKITHLGNLQVGYRLTNNAIDPSKPTLVCINSMCMTTALFDAQFNDNSLTGAMNILAIEPLGHGATTFPTKASHFTYWDSAIVALEVMTALNVEKAFVLGTSQGGWIVVRMALLAPERILGLLPLGTSMDAETPETREKGCWDPVPVLNPFAQKWTSAAATPEFKIDDQWCGMVASLGFGAHATEQSTDFWTEVLKETYKGDGGRRKARMAVLCLMLRDSVTLRLGDVTCPVYWLQGAEDVVYGCQVQHEQIELFAASKEKKLSIVEGGAHYLSATNPKEVNEAVLEMVRKYAP
ncbi:putative alpha/beta hydrolase [Didymella exigua CBS 183.55]|uniref:Putative alpha/beta hydrolase n=1 Tax=Didymella exigua CBS 183.55 TaxID=1150837 RepID=A0A6A5RTP9_9PLEO|nr:putative alpha/beta hydrolase [Didymella exigua CBS 183.55]KAF1931222.1 putative alpha/beta hydrolase [Didymella exigua CBS 183.55]